MNKRIAKKYRHYPNGHRLGSPRRDDLARRAWAFWWRRFHRVSLTDTVFHMTFLVSHQDPGSSASTPTDTIAIQVVLLGPRVYHKLPLDPDRDGG